MRFTSTNSALRKVLAQMKPIAVNADYAPLLTGALVEVRDGMVTLTATDRYRIIYARLEAETEGLRDGSAVVPIVPLQRALRTVLVGRSGGADAVTVSVADTAVRLDLRGGVSVRIPMLDGDYPDVWKLLGTILPKDELLTHAVNAEYARDILPRESQPGAQLTSSVGEKGYTIVGHRDSLSVLVPVDYGRPQPFKVPEFIEARMAEQ